MVNLISIGLRGGGLVLSSITAFFLQAGQILGTLFLGIFIGLLIWSVADLIFGFFQDRPTQGINSGISLVNVLIPIPFFQYAGSVYLITGLVFGVIIAGFVDWATKSKRKRRR